jgi:hypothetical protein
LQPDTVGTAPAFRRDLHAERRRGGRELQTPFTLGPFRNVYDEVEDFAAKNGVRRATIWRRVLQAYKSGELTKRYVVGATLPPDWSLDAVLDNSIRGALAALAIEDFVTAHWAWIKCLLADEEFDRWFRRTFSARGKSRTNTRVRIKEALNALASRTEGPPFKTKAEIYQAVLRHCGVSGDQLPRGWHYKTFAPLCPEPRHLNKKLRHRGS